MEFNNFKLKITNYWKKKKNDGNIREFIGRLSRGLMLPISLLPIAGLFLGIGAAIVNNSFGNEGLATFGRFLQLPGDAIFGALPVLFAIAIAITFTRDAGTAGLSAMVAFLAFSGLQQSLITPVFDPTNENLIIGYNLLYFHPDMWNLSGGNGFALNTSLFGTVLGWRQLSTSVFGGFIVGFVVAFLYNKFKDIQLPSYISFFSGVRFIPVITFLAFIPITLLVLMFWPLIGTLFSIIGGALGSGMYGFQSFIFGFIERSLVPFGLHHAFYAPLWYTSIGGELNLNDLAIVGGNFVNGNLTWHDIATSHGSLSAVISVGGDQNIWAFANSFLVGKSVEMVDGTLRIISFSDLTTTVYTESFNNLGEAGGVLSQGVNIGQYLQGKYPFMIFGLPAAGLAMVMAAPKENRKMAGSIVLSAALTSFITGITEPIEFTFLFLAPWLFWGFHAFFCGLAFGIMNWIGLIFPGIAPHIGMTFSGGMLDWVIYGAIQIPGGSNAWVALIVGLAYAPIYFFFFLWAIKRFNISTPGRGGNTKLFTKADYLSTKSNVSSSGYDPQVLGIIQAYGGINNIETVDACITKLRIKVLDETKVQEKVLKDDLGAMGIIKPAKKAIYAIYGGKADFIKNKINEIITDVKTDPKLKDEIFKVDHTKDLKFEADTKEDNKNRANEVLKVYAPFDGEIVSMKEVPDKTFSDNIMGKGVAIKPTSNTAYSVIEEGKMDVVFETGHAYIFKSKEGTGILVHIGIDSINHKESSKDVSIFDKKVKVGSKIKKGDEISKIDLPKLKKYAKSTITPIVALNETLDGRKIEIKVKSGKVKKGDELFTIKP